MEGVRANDINRVRQFIHQAGHVQDGTTALIQAVRVNNVDMVRLLVPREAKLTDASGWTALMWAEDYQNVQVLELLVPLEANMTDTNGLTALMWAAKSGKQESALFLARYEN